jgi:pyridoxamine 5'-phosphate oxidase
VPSGDAAAAQLLADPLPAEPLATLAAWIEEARATRPNPDAMALATVDPDGRPSARMVVLRGLEHDPGFLVFYTNHQSRKGRALAAHPRAALVFHWDALGRQARVEGPVTRSPDTESDAYFVRRPLDARLGAWASRQSAPVATREDLEARFAEVARRFRAQEAGVQGEIPRPPFWGGYRVWAEQVELWVGRVGRLHDRVLWRRALAPVEDGFRAGAWRRERLQP